MQNIISKHLYWIIEKCSFFLYPLRLLSFILHKLHFIEKIWSIYLIKINKERLIDYTRRDISVQFGEQFFQFVEKSLCSLKNIILQVRSKYKWSNSLLKKKFSKVPENFKLNFWFWSFLKFTREFNPEDVAAYLADTPNNCFLYMDMAITSK